MVVASFFFHISSFHSIYEIQNLHNIAEKVHAQSASKSSLLLNSSETLERALELKCLAQVIQEAMPLDSTGYLDIRVLYQAQET